MRWLRALSLLLVPVLLLLGCRHFHGDDHRGYEECSARCPWEGECKWDLIDTGNDTAQPDYDFAWDECDWCCKEEYLHLE